MQIFNHLWIVILIAVYIGWTVYVFSLKRGMSWLGWFEGYGFGWIILNAAGLFIASLVSYVL